MNKLLTNYWYILNNRKFAFNINHIRTKVISKSTHLLKITRDVARSKNLPSPSINFEGGHDFTNRFTHPEVFIRLRDCNNSFDRTNGFAIILNGPTMRMNKSTATAENKIITTTGTSNVEVIMIYRAKLSQIVTAPTIMDIMGCLNTELCKSVSICKFR